MPNWGKLREQRQGVMLHYDGSASDAGAVTWITKDPRCAVSYTTLITDDGQVIPIAPRDARAWHAGVCRPSDAERMPYADANSAFYGVALAARSGDIVLPAQYAAVVAHCVTLFHEHDWTADELWRITDHAGEAWPRGRKVDIGRSLRLADGSQLTVERIRRAVEGKL